MKLVGRLRIRMLVVDGEGECSHIVLLDLLSVTILMTRSQVLGRDVTPT